MNHDEIFMIIFFTFTRFYLTKTMRSRESIFSVNALNIFKSLISFKILMNKSSIFLLTFMTPLFQMPYCFHLKCILLLFIKINDIHPRVSYSLGEYIFIFPEPACYKCVITPNETKKTHTCKILLANIF